MNVSCCHPQLLKLILLIINQCCNYKTADSTLVNDGLLTSRYSEVDCGGTTGQCSSLCLLVFEICTPYRYMIGLIKRNFIHMDSRTFIMLYKAMVRPHVEYTNSIWPPYKKDIEAIEKVQKTATKLIISLKELPYKKRLLQLNLHTLKYRRLRGDMIEVYKIIHDNV